MKNTLRVAGLLIMFGGSAFSLNNGIKLTAPVSTANFPESLQQTFIDNEILQYPQPYVNGTPATIWQANNIKRYQSGYVQSATISFLYTTDGTEKTITFRNNSNPCSAGDQTACEAAAMTKAQMLAAVGSTWNASMTATANPAGSTTARTFSARSVLSADKYAYWIKGPAMTEVIVGDLTTARSEDFGWKRSEYMMLAANIESGTTTSISVNGSDWSSLSRPFRIFVQNEIISICFATGTTLTVGTTNGSSSACANTAGRGVDGTTATYHFIGSHGTWLALDTSGVRITADVGPYDTTVNVNDASGFSTASVIQIGEEQMRVCNKSGNVLTIGTAAWPCTGDTGGRTWRGTNYGWGSGGHFHINKTPVHTLAYYNTGLGADQEVAGRWVDAPSDNFKTIHTQVHLRFPSTGDKVAVKFIVTTAFMDRMQDQRVDLSFTFSGTNAPATYTLSNIEFKGRTTLGFPQSNHATGQENVWWINGTHLNATRVKRDYGAAYQFAVGRILQDPNTVVSESTIQSFLDTGYSSSIGTAPSWSGGTSTCAPDTVSGTANNGTFGLFNGPMVRVTNAPGGRMELVLGKSIGYYVKSWDKSATINSKMREMIENMAHCQGKIPYHYLEGQDAAGFCDGWAYAANTADKACTGSNLTARTFGRIPSPVVYNEICPGNQAGVADGNSKRYPQGPVTSGGFVATVSGAWSHNPSPSYWAAIYSTDYYAWFVTQTMAGSALVSNDYPGWYRYANGTDRTYSRGPWLAGKTNDGIRSWAYHILNVAQGAITARAGSPEEELFLTWLKRDVAIQEGKFNWTGGSYYRACPANVATTYLYEDSPWCWGWWRSLNPTDTTNVYWTTEIGTGYQLGDGLVNPLRGFSAMSVWMDAYLYTAMVYRDRNLPQVLGTPLTTELARRNLIRKLTEPVAGLEPFLMANYQIPANTCLPEGTDVSPNCSSRVNTNGSQQGFSTYQYWKEAVASGSKGMLSAASDNDFDSGYANLSYAVVKLFPKVRYDVGTGIMTGKKGIEFWAQNLRGYSAGVALNPYWDHGLWGAPTVTATAGDNTVRLSTDEVLRAADTCKAAISSSPFTDLDDASDTAMTMTGQTASVVFTGLFPAVQYYWRVNCGEQRKYGTVTTLSLGSSAITAVITQMVPSGRGIATVRVNYGSTESLGTTVDTACSGGVCSVSIPAQTKRATFYRLSYLNGGGAQISQGPITSFIGR